MKTMETELQRLDNELYTIYQRSLDLAVYKWLPKIEPNKGSYNSYPHIKGVMRQIDRLLYGDEKVSFFLNSSELYILLCAILMHDIGKGMPKEANKVEDHGGDSSGIIKEHWAVLGLPTEKVANIIAGICRSHDCKSRAEMEKLQTKYYIDYFNRTEPIRGRLLGALLFLGDHMDNTFTRVVPKFFDKGAWNIVGEFRSKIVDVSLDRENKMVKEILDKTLFGQEDLSGVEMLQGDLAEYLSNVQGNEPEKMNETSLLHVIAKDVIKNEQAIAIIKDELNIMDMPVKKWLIECDEQLFQVEKRKNENGTDMIDSTFALEPIINQDYCLEVLKGICMLSGGIFGRKYFQYSELVNFIREEENNTYKVKTAVGRLSLLLRAKGTCDYEINANEYNWGFFCTKNTPSMKEAEVNGSDKKDIVYDTLKKIIMERLGK